MRRFHRRRDQAHTTTPQQSARIDLAGHSSTPLENAAVIRAYLQPQHDARRVTAGAPEDATTNLDAQTVQLRLNALDLNALLHAHCGAPALTVLDELSGCFYDMFFAPAANQQLVACAAFSQRNQT